MADGQHAQSCNLFTCFANRAGRHPCHTTLSRRAISSGVAVRRWDCERHVAGKLIHLGLQMLVHRSPSPNVFAVSQGIFPEAQLDPPYLACGAI